MAANVGNWVSENCSTEGVGDLILVGTQTGQATFAGAIVAGEVYYSIQDGSNREAGIGTFDGNATIVRTTVTATLVAGNYIGSGPTAISLSGEAVVSCTYNASAFEDVSSDAAAAASATAAAASAAAALVSENAAAADAVLTAADVISTNSDAAQTATDLIATNANVVLTSQDAIDTGNDLISTNQDTIDTAADRVQTSLDVTASSNSASAASTSETNAASSAAAALVSENNAAATLANALTQANNLSDVASAVTARQNLGLEIGVDVQAFDSILSATTASFLVADETKLDGVESGATKTSRKNYIINGNFDVWQRGTSALFTNANTLVADRWESLAIIVGSITVSQQTFTLGQTDVPNSPKFFEKLNQTSGSYRHVHRVEGVNNLSGGSAKLSFHARAGAALNLTAFIAQNFGSGGSPSSNITVDASTVFALTTSFQKFELDISFPSISGKTLGTNGDDFIFIGFNTPSGVADIDVSQFQLEKGSIATDFEHQSYGEVLEQCRRYYRKIQAVVGGDRLATGYTGATTGSFQLDIGEMRAAPTVTFDGVAADYSVAISSATVAGSILPTASSTKHNINILLTTAGGLAVDAGAHLRAVNSTAAINLDAEL